MFNDFLNLCIFSLFVISVINRLTSDDGDFVCCRVISEMQHAPETRLPFYKWGSGIFFTSVSTKKCLGYVTALVGLIFVLDLVGKLILIK